MSTPTNDVTRLSAQTVVEVEVLRRFLGLDSVRSILESLVAEAVNDRLGNKKFVEVLRTVRAEGIEAS